MISNSLLLQWGLTIGNKEEWSTITITFPIGFSQIFYSNISRYATTVLDFDKSDYTTLGVHAQCTDRVNISKTYMIIGNRYKLFWLTMGN